MILTDTLRPRKWEDVVGQKENVTLLQKIVEKPNVSPKILIFEGAWGSGKTCCARVFASDILKIPYEDLGKSVFDYYEYNCSEHSTADFRDIMDLTVQSSTESYAVVLFDEFHTASIKTQQDLLNDFEAPNLSTFYILCTTEIEKVIDPIRSRAMELNFGLVEYSEIINHISGLESILGLSIPEKIRESIALHSKGHMREAHILLNKFKLLGEEKFLENCITSMDMFCDYFLAICDDDQKELQRILNELINKPLQYLKTDFDEFILKCSKETAGISCGSSKIKEVSVRYGSNFTEVIKLYFSDWILKMFDCEAFFHLCMLNYYKELRGKI